MEDRLQHQPTAHVLNGLTPTSSQQTLFMNEDKPESRSAKADKRGSVARHFRTPRPRIRQCRFFEQLGHGFSANVRIGEDRVRQQPDSSGK
jgi:hypothetical protein